MLSEWNKIKVCKFVIMLLNLNIVSLKYCFTVYFAEKSILAAEKNVKYCLYFASRVSCLEKRNINHKLSQTRLKSNKIYYFQSIHNI